MNTEHFVTNPHSISSTLWLLLEGPIFRIACGIASAIIIFTLIGINCQGIGHKYEHSIGFVNVYRENTPSSGHLCFCLLNNQQNELKKFPSQEVNSKNHC